MRKYSVWERAQNTWNYASIVRSTVNRNTSTLGSSSSSSSSSSSVAEKNYSPLHYAGNVSSEPIFCVNALGGERFAIAGSDGMVRVIELIKSDLSSTGGTSSSSSTSPSSSGSLFKINVRSAWAGHDSGMLGMSSDMDHGTLVTGSFAGEGRVWKLNSYRAGSNNSKFKQHLSNMSIKAIKTALQNRGLPYDDVREKQELINRLARVTPPAECIGRLNHPIGANIVSTSHYKDIVVTGSRDGTAIVWKIPNYEDLYIPEETNTNSLSRQNSNISRVSSNSSTGSTASSSTTSPSLGSPTAASSSTSSSNTHGPIPRLEEVAVLRGHDPGVDAVHYDPRWNHVFTGGKDGVVRVWDIERLDPGSTLTGGNTSSRYHDKYTSKCIQSYNAGECWVWMLRSGSTYYDAAGYEPGVPRLEETFPEKSNNTSRSSSSIPFSLRINHHQNSSDTTIPLISTTATTSQNEQRYEEMDEDEEIGDGVFLPVNRDEPLHFMGEEEINTIKNKFNNSSSGSYDSSSSLGDGWSLFSGTTNGDLRLHDLRSKLIAHHARIKARNPRYYNNWSVDGAAPITGISTMFAHHRFVTSSFDGCARIWDLRMFRPIQILAGPRERLARIEVSSTLAVSGCMDGNIHMWSFLSNEDRAEIQGL